MHFVQKAQVKVRVEGLGEGVFKGVEMRHALSIIEGHQSSLVIQIDADPRQRLLQRQYSRRRCSRHVLNSVRQRERPEAVDGHRVDDAFPRDGFTSDSHRPHGAAVHFHFPVMSTFREALTAQQRQSGVESLRVVLHGVVEGLIAHARER